ncbi:TetR/AcrR family transcriptional regulator [Methylobacterium trifolii]|uniref:HTH-type transcriptional repressor NicS n=1 Tax=Methylobacterium trifolii TaxID=1003092 RepID=A0ABQ4U0D5_9HYPH|nr:TetR/AcrR family transcriptional regulator [Methylobacterium trifolii]GJE59580.1 HTH-type transcriptional repressor NicS [Methylobacterium trifolii]
MSSETDEPVIGQARRRPRSRVNDPERTRTDILAVATEEFAAHGLSGARVDAIAERTRTSKRMIYYYFGGKEGLYLAVLERAYSEIRALEASIDLDALDPEAAIRALVETTFDYDETHPDFVRLVGIENIHRAEHIAASAVIRELNVTIIGAITAILRRGQAAGRFRAGIDPIDLHMLISAFCFFRVANRHTFGAIFAVDLAEPATRERHRRLIGDAVIRYLAAG